MEAEAGLSLTCLLITNDMTINHDHSDDHKMMIIIMTTMTMLMTDHNADGDKEMGKQCKV